jgi:hypothetical protein
VLLDRPEIVEHGGVLLGQQHVVGHRIGLDGKPQPVRHLAHHGVGRVVEVGRHLHRQLPAGPQGRPPAGQHGPVVGDPVQGGVRQHDVIERRSRPQPDVVQLEGEPVTGQCVGQHRRRRVDADRRLRPQGPVGERRQPPVAAAEVDDSPARHDLDHGQQVVERLVPLRLEPPVLGGVPAIGFAA